MNNAFLGRAALGRITLGVVALLLTALAALAVPEPEPTKWNVDGVEREALIFPPSAKAPSGRAPVIFVFHGHGGSMHGSAKMGFQNLWPEAIVICMQGLPTPTPRDPQGKLPSWELAPGQFGDRDFKFFDAVLAAVRQNYAVNNRRIYCTGFSAGAIFTYLLWEERGKIFAGYAPCAGRIFPGASLGPPRPIIHIAGEKDAVVNYEYQLQTLAAVREHNGCADAGKPWGDGCTLYPSSKGAPLVTYIHSGGHVYPPGATKRIVQFLKEHALPANGAAQ
jgi:polyhydroxybutyrate depolymerase